MTTLTIIASGSGLYKDSDHSIGIPDTGELERKIETFEMHGTEPEVSVFTEYLGHGSHYEGAKHPAVKLGGALYLVWIEGRKEWVGIQYNYDGSCTETDGTNEWITSSGPYALNLQCAELIKKAYKSTLLIEEILHTPPEKLRA